MIMLRLEGLKVGIENLMKSLKGTLLYLTFMIMSMTLKIKKKSNNSIQTMRVLM